MRSFEALVLSASGTILRRFLVVAFSRGAAMSQAAGVASETLGAADYTVLEA